MLPDICTDEAPCIHGFSFGFDVVFRPAKYVMQRDQYGDKPVLVFAPDKAYFAKYEPIIDPWDGVSVDPQDHTGGQAPVLGAPLTSAWTCCVSYPGPPLPPMANVPLPAGFLMLLLALSVLAMWKILDDGYRPCR